METTEARIESSISHNCCLKPIESTSVGDTYSDFETTVVEEESSVGADESVLLFGFEVSGCNLSHFSYLSNK